MWSSAFIAGIFGLRSAPPLLLMLMRFAAAGMILAVVAWVTRAPWPRGRQLGHVIVAGLLLVSVPVLGVLTLAIEPIRVSHPLELAGSLAWLVVVNSIGAVTLLYAMLRHRPASQVSSLIFLSPAVTAILAYLIVGQSLGWLTIAGLVVSGAGVSLTTRAPAAPAARGHGDREATRDPGSRVTASRARAAAGASR